MLAAEGTGEDAMTHPMNGAAAICGLGITAMGRVYRDAEDLAAEAVYLALEAREDSLPP